MAKVKLKGTKFINSVVSHDQQTQKAVHSETHDMAMRAESRLLMHRDHSDAIHHEIETSFGDTDGFVSLVGPAPMSLEFGHMLVYYGKPTGRFIKGLHILYLSMGEIG